MTLALEELQALDQPGLEGQDDVQEIAINGHDGLVSIVSAAGTFARQTKCPAAGTGRR
jgi:hypothetical protein